MSLNALTMAILHRDCNGELNDFLEKGLVVVLSKFSAQRFSPVASRHCTPDFTAQVTTSSTISKDQLWNLLRAKWRGLSSLQDRRAGDARKHLRYMEHQPPGEGQNLSLGYRHEVALFLQDADFDGGTFFGAAGFDVNVNVGAGIVSHITERIALATSHDARSFRDRGGRGKLGRRNREGEMKGSVRITLLGVFAAALMVLSPFRHLGPCRPVAAKWISTHPLSVVHNTPAILTFSPEPQRRKQWRYRHMR